MYRGATEEQLWKRRVGRSTLLLALTSVNTAQRRWLDAVPSSSMRVLPRDYQLLWWVSRFKQLSTAQLMALVFPEAASRTSCDRAISRLVASDQLELVNQPRSGGRQGGSVPNVYQLGPKGWPLFFTGRRKIRTTIDYHALTIADTFIHLHTASRDGILDLLEWQTEPDCWTDVAGADLRPDLYLDIGIPSKGDRLRLWLEVDLGGERQKQITDKLERYIYAYSHAESYHGDVFPQVVFLCMTEPRKRELEAIVRRLAAPEGLVQIELVSDLSKLYT